MLGEGHSPRGRCSLWRRPAPAQSNRGRSVASQRNSSSCGSRFEPPRAVKGYGKGGAGGYVILPTSSVQRPVAHTSYCRLAGWRSSAPFSDGIVLGARLIRSPESQRAALCVTTSARTNGRVTEGSRLGCGGASFSIVPAAAPVPTVLAPDGRGQTAETYIHALGTLPAQFTVRPYDYIRAPPSGYCMAGYVACC